MVTEMWSAHEHDLYYSNVTNLCSRTWALVWTNNNMSTLGLSLLCGLSELAGCLRCVGILTGYLGQILNFVKPDNIRILKIMTSFRD